MPNYMVTASSLNVRRGPGIEEDVLDVLFENQVVAELAGGLGVLSEGSSTTPGVVNYMRIDGDRVPDGWALLNLLSIGANGRVTVSGVTPVDVYQLPRNTNPVIGTLSPGQDLPKGEYISAQNNPTVRRWVHVDLGGGRSGFASMSYLQPTTSAPTIGGKQYHVTADALTVRNGPDINADPVGFLKLNTVVPEGPITQAGERRWMQISAPSGYASMKFLALNNAAPKAPPGSPRWYEIAKTQLGVKERSGEADNPQIVQYHRSTNLPRSLQNQDETAWCSSFVNWCMEQAGVEGTDSAMARSWLKWGKSISTPTLGCVVVFRRGQNPSQGHVAFFVKTVGTDIEVLGGNQSDAVTFARYPASRVLGYRQP